MSDSLSWFTQTLADVPESDDWLSSGERKLLDGMRFQKRRNDWRLGRWTAKQAICAYQLKKDPLLSSLEIRAAADGAPEAYWNDEPGYVSISISHSRDRGFCVVGPRGYAIGCDLEFVQPLEDNFAEDYFTPEEKSFLKQAPAADRLLAINLIWSAKETTLKILREGLRRDTRSVAVHVDSWAPETGWNSWRGRCLESSRTFYGWWRSEQGYVYTIGSDHLTAAPDSLRV